MDAPKRYHPALVTLHWLMVVLVFINLYLGIVVFENQTPGSGPQGFQAMNTLVTIHMAIGLAIIVLLIGRFIVRLRTSKPVDATAGNKYLDMLAKVVHYGLYLAVLAVTVLGLVFSLQSGRFQSAFLGARSQFGGPGPGGGGFPGANQTPGAGQVAPPNDGTVTPGNNGGNPQGGPNGQGRRGGPGGPGGFFGLLTFHEWTAYLLLFLVVLHIGAALYHQFIRRDNLIARMWYGPR